MLAGWGAMIVMALALLIQKYQLASTVGSNGSVLLDKLMEHMNMYLVNKEEFILKRTQDPILVFYSSDSTPLSARERYAKRDGDVAVVASVSSVAIGSCTASQRQQNRHTCTYRHTCIYLGAYIHTYMDTHVSI